MTEIEAIVECRIHRIEAIVGKADGALIDGKTGDVIAYADEHAEYYGADIILGYLG